MTETDPQSNLTTRILIGMGVGFVLGLGLNLVGVDGQLGEFIVDGLLYVGGEIFLASLKLLVVPLVFVSLVCGTASLDDITKLEELLNRVGWPKPNRADGRSIEIAVAVQFVLATSDSEICAFAVVADEFGLDESTVRRHYRKHQSSQT